MSLTSAGIALKPSASCAFYTYAHINPTTNKVFYIGKGTKSRHLATAKRNLHWTNIVNKYGFFAEILAYWNTSEEALSHEKLLISCFNNMGYVLANKTSGGEDCHLSDETRKKIAISQIGKKRSEKARRNMSIAAFKRGNKNRPPCKEETKILLSKKLTGRIMSEESRLKMIATKLSKRGQS